MANNLVLPDEMINEIILRLPEESLLRFKSVCHAWNTRISSPTFIKSYREKNYNTKRMMMYAGNHNSTIHSFSLSRKDEGRCLETFPHDIELITRGGYKIAGSCDGLLLLVVQTHSLCIWNPFTRQYKQIPSIGNYYDTSYGFGCARGESYGDKYKVLSIQRSVLSEGLSEVCLYSSRRNAWRKKNEVAYIFCGDSSALVNGKLHFLARGLYHLQRVLVAFGIGDEEFEEVPEPYYEVGYLTSCNVMSELNGKLCIVSFKEEMPEKKYVWLMKEYGVKQTWTNVFCINVNNIRCLGVNCYYVRPLHFDIDGKILLHAYFRVSWDNKHDMLLIYYDTQNQEVRILKPDGRSNRYFATIYAETPVSPNAI